MRIYPGTTVDYEFAELGTLGYSGTLNDRQFAALRAEGLTGSLPDMFGQFDGTLGGGVSGFIVNVPSGKVTADLTNFTTPIDLSLIDATRKAEFWAAVRSDGGNIRAYAADGVTQIPMDLTYIHKTRQLGRLVVKTNLLTASDNSIVLKVLDAATTGLAVTDPYGRNAVWADYEVVWVFPEVVNRTGKSYSQTMTGLVPQSEWIRTDYSPVLPGNPHQGVAVDGTGRLITVDDAGIRRHTTSNYTTTLASNLTFIADLKTVTGDTLLNHSSAGCFIGTEFWVPVNEYPNTGGSFNEYLAVYDRDTLVYSRNYDLSSVGRHISAIVYNPADSTIYATDYLNGASLMKFSTSGSYLGTVTLSATLIKPQGITIVDGKFIISCEDTPDLYQCDFDGSGVTAVHDKPEAGVPEGLSYDGASKLYYLDGSGDLVVLERLAQFADWGRIHYDAVYTRLPRAVVHSFGVSAYWQHPDGDRQQAFVALENDASAASTGSATVTNILYDDGPDFIGLWNSTDSWLYSNVNPAFKDTFRVAAKQNSTTERKLFVDGVLKGTDATTSARPSGTGTNMEFILNASNRFGSNYGEAYYQYAWLRADYVSDAWMAADAAFMNDPASMYTIT